MDYINFTLVVLSLLSIGFAYMQSSVSKKKVSLDEKGNNFDKLSRKNYSSFFFTEKRIPIFLAIATGGLLLLNTIGLNLEKPYISIAYFVGVIASFIASYAIPAYLNKIPLYSAYSAEKSYSDSGSTNITGAMANSTGIQALIIIVLALISYFLKADEYNSTLINNMENVLFAFLLGVGITSLYFRYTSSTVAKGVEMGIQTAASGEFPVPVGNPLSPANFSKITARNFSKITGFDSDAFFTLSGALISAMICGAGFIVAEPFKNDNQLGAVMLPLAVATAGLIIGLLSLSLLKLKDQSVIKRSLNTSYYAVLGLNILSFYYLTKTFLPANWEITQVSRLETITYTYSYLGAFWSLIIGLGAGYVMPKFNEFYTGNRSGFVRSIAENTKAGSSANILSGFEQSFTSVLFPVAIIAIASIASHYFAGVYGITLAAVGLLMNSGIYTSIETYNRFSENANEISRQLNLSYTAISTTEKLKDTENLQASAKTFQNAATIMAGISLLSVLLQFGGVNDIGFNLSNPSVLSFFILGSALPFLFSGLTISSIIKISGTMSEEIKRQFNDVPELKAGLEIYKKYSGDLTQALPEENEIYQQALGAASPEKCIGQSSKKAAKEILMPYVICLVVPTITGIFGGFELLTTLLGGFLASSLVLTAFQTDIGNFWNSTKKYFDKGDHMEDTGHLIDYDIYRSAARSQNIGSYLKDAVSPVLLAFLKVFIIASLVMVPRISNDHSKKDKNLFRKNKTEQSITIEPIFPTKGK